MQSTHLCPSPTQLMWELLAGNRTAVLPRRAWVRRFRSYTLICAPVNTNLTQEAHIHQPTAWRSNCPWLPLPGGIWLCACLRYWQGRWVVYVCPLLYICPHARTVRERSREWGWGRNIALFQRPKVYVVDNIGVLHAWILALYKHTDTIRI